MRIRVALHEGQYYWYLICRCIKLLGCSAVFENLSIIRTTAANLLARLLQLNINISAISYTYISILTHTHKCIFGHARQCAQVVNMQPVAGDKSSA